MMQPTRKATAKQYFCDFPDCGKIFTRSDHLSTHKCIHTGERKYACDFLDCGKRFVHASHLKRHKDAVHCDSRFFRCHFCDATFKSKVTFREHNLNEHKYSEFACLNGECTLFFPSRSKLKHHQQFHCKYRAALTVPGMLDNVNTSAVVSSKTTSLGMDHQSSGSERGAVLCVDIMGTKRSRNVTSVPGNGEDARPPPKVPRYEAPAVSPVSREIYFNQKSQKFPGCGKSYGHPDSLASHAALHYNKRGFMCGAEECGKRFMNASHLGRHEREVHGRRFPQHPSLSSSTSSVHTPASSADVMEETVVGDGFGGVDTGEREADGEGHRARKEMTPLLKAFPCRYPGCSRSYVKKPGLRAHVMISHTREEDRPFACLCDSCPRRFGTKQIMTKHYEAVHIHGKRERRVRVPAINAIPIGDGSFLIIRK